jgi:transcriptional regulator with XRE-family HTH domain
MSRRRKAAASDDEINHSELGLKIRYLFENYKKDNGEEYVYRDIELASNGRVSSSWLSKLYNGQATGTSFEVLRELTKFFGIDGSFWFKSLEQWKAEAEKSDDENKVDEFSARIAARARGLPEDAQKAIINLLDSIPKEKE